MIIILNQIVNYLLKKKKGKFFSKIGKVYNHPPPYAYKITKNGFVSYSILKAFP